MEPVTATGYRDDRNWKRAGLIGVGAALLIGAVRAGTVTDSDLFWMPIWFIAVWVILMFTVFREGRKALQNRPELLVPVGLVLLFDVLVGALEQWPRLAPIMATWVTIRAGSLVFEPNLAWAMRVVVWTVFATWQTDLLIRAVTQSGPPSLDPREPVRRGVGRGFGAMAVGYVGLAVIAMPLGGVFADFFVVYALCLVLVSMLFSVTTAAFLPFALMSPEPIGSALKSALRWGWSNKWRLFPRAAVLLMLAGMMTYFDLSWDGGRGWAFNVRTIWAGGYPSAPQWYVDHQNLMRVPVSPFVATIQGMLVLTTAVAFHYENLLQITAKAKRIADPASSVGSVEAASVNGHAEPAGVGLHQ